MVKINKSSMHSRITGDFAERLVLYWLSKYGFESMYVDHVGIDLVAKNPKTNEKMGISVKSRSRSDTAKKGEHLNIGKYVETKNKILKACKAFDLVPYFAIVVDEGNEIMLYIISLEKFIKISPPKKILSWKMQKKWKDLYEKDEEIKVVKFEHKILNWW